MNNIINQFIRSFLRKPVYSIITFTGFSIGILAGILIYLWIFNELSYEKLHPNYDRIYRVLSLSKVGGNFVKSAGSYRPLAKTMKNDYPQIEFATYLSYRSESTPLKTESGGEKIEAQCFWTNDDFFQVFRGFTFIEGTVESAFSDPSNIILSEDVAQKLFGDDQAFGKTLISDEYSPIVYKVSGVVKIPKLSHINFGFILSERNSQVSYLSDNWGDRFHVHTYIKIRENAQVDGNFIQNITNHVGRYTNSARWLPRHPSPS